ncbi:MAG: thiamine phosphate synthase [Nitrospirota bacterium]
MNVNQKQNRFVVDFKLLLITGGKPPRQKWVDIISEAGEAGVRAVQFRAKDLPLREQFIMAGEIEKVTKRFGMKLFINDRIDLCLAINADGVHLPAAGLPVPVARQLLGKTKGIGVSCHSLEEVLRAESDGADYAVLGPIYDTASKRPYGAPLGIDSFRQVRQWVSIPLFAIGGIKTKQIPEVMKASADAVAMISEIMEAREVKAQCRVILNQIESCGQRNAFRKPQMP